MKTELLLYKVKNIRVGMKMQTSADIEDNIVSLEFETQDGRFEVTMSNLPEHLMNRLLGQFGDENTHLSNLYEEFGI